MRIFIFMCSLAMFYHASAKEAKSVLVWNEEFNYIGLPDSMKWDFSTVGNLWQWGNGELQQYTRMNSNNAYVSNGSLKIRVLNEDGKITSARLHTKDKGEWEHARIEVRAKLAAGRGLWSAIWLLPSNWKFSDKYIDGEIDIVEHVGFNADSTFHSTHTYTHSFDRKNTYTLAELVPDCETEFHNYTVEWDRQSVCFFVDDILVGSYLHEGHQHLRWTFNQSYYLILNVAVGGAWASKNGIDKDCFPSEMQVDYVRVYRIDD